MFFERLGKSWLAKLKAVLINTENSIIYNVRKLNEYHAINREDD